MAVGMGSTSVTAFSREQLRNQMKTSMMGRRAGMDVNDYECGEQDTRLPIDNITSTVQTSMAPNGFSILSCTVASTAQHTLLNPVAGIYKQITQISSSTLGIMVQFGAGAQIITTIATSHNALVFAGFGHTVNLCCLATASSVGGVGGVWVATATMSTASGLYPTTY